MLSGSPTFYQNNLHKEGAQDVVNINKIKFKLYGDLVYLSFSQFNESLMKNQDPHSQTENDETSEPEYPNESKLEEGETNKISALPNFMPQILTDDEIAESMNY